MFRKNSFILLFVLLWSVSIAQETAPTIQPTIMAIPFAKEGQSIRSVYENNELVRIAITKIKEAFDSRGVNTIDLRAKLKQVNNNEILTEEQQTSLKDDLIALSGADIYVEIEANPNYTKTGNSVSLIMTAYDAVSGESLANKVANSPKFYTEDLERLTEKAVEAEADNLLNVMQEKFTDIRENGRTIVLTIGVDQVADFDLDAKTMEGDLLSELIEDWVADNSFKNYYHIQGSTETKMIFDIVKVPVKDNKGRNFRISKFAAKFRNFIKEEGYTASRDIQGNNIVITLNNVE